MHDTDDAELTMTAADIAHLARCKDTFPAGCVVETVSIWWCLQQCVAMTGTEHTQMPAHVQLALPLSVTPPQHPGLLHSAIVHAYALTPRYTARTIFLYTPCSSAAFSFRQVARSAILVMLSLGWGMVPSLEAIWLTKALRSITSRPRLVRYSWRMSIKSCTCPSLKANRLCSHMD